MTTVVVVVVDVCSDVIFFVLIQSWYLPFKHFNTPGGKYLDLMNDDYVSTRVVRCTMQDNNIQNKVTRKRGSMSRQLPVGPITIHSSECRSGIRYFNCVTWKTINVLNVIFHLAGVKTRR